MTKENRTMKLYHYDHCPYCVKARMIFGLKKVEFELIPLANDDEKTPTDLIGQKMLPILIKEDGTALPESLDIIHFIDENYGETKNMLQYENSRSDIKQWLQDSREFAYHLAMPRWIQMSLDEFKTASAKNYFQEKKERQSIGSFKEAFAKTENYMAMANMALVNLSEVLSTDNSIHGPNIVHIDDLHLFAGLRGLTTTKGLKWPDNVLNYIKHWSEKSNVNLFFDQAI